MGLQSKALFLTLMSGTSTVATSTAVSMLAAEQNGLALDFTDSFFFSRYGLYGSASVKDLTTIANNYNSIPGDLLTYSGTTKLTRQSYGVYRYGPHNLPTYSQTFDNAAWTKTRSAVLAAQATAPDGTLTAYSYTEDSTASSTHALSPTAFTTVTGALYAYSVWVKANTRSVITLFVSGPNVGKYFDLANGTVLGNDTAAPTDATIESLGSGWYKCTIVFAASTTSHVPLCYLANTTTNRVYTGNGTSGIYIWQAHGYRYPADTTYLATTTAARYGLPFEWDANGTLQGILVEPQATNLFLNNTTGATQTVTVTNATAYTVSFFGTGSITFSGANSSTLNGTGATDRVSTTFTTSSTSLTCTVSGSITDVQVEAGSVATSVIRTYAASATRAADSKTKATSALPWSATLGTVSVEGTTANGSGTQVLWQADDGSENNRFRIVRDSSNHIRFIVTTASSEVCNIDLGAVANSTAFKVAVAWAANDFAACLNGGTVGTDASGALPTVNTVRFGSSFTGEQWNRYRAKDKYLPRRATNGELQTMST